MVQKIYFQNGDTYEGDVNSSKELQGQGKYQYSNGSYYKGEFIRGQYNGKGVFYDSNTNTTIQGDFKNSLPNGSVIIQYSDKSQYEGQIIDGLKFGQGIYTYPPKNYILQYKGQFQQDKFEGQGILEFRNGIIMQGEFVKGKCEGNIVLTKKNSQFFYKGKMKNNKKHDNTGKAVLQYENGDKYTGCFLNDQKNLEGKLQYKDGSIYQGEWHENKKHGKGKFKFNTGEQYIGQFKNGKFHGQGKYIFTEVQQQNGIKQYEGMFEDGKANGEGSLQYFNSTNILTGKFSNNTKHGISKLVIFKTLQNNQQEEYAQYQGEFVYNIEKTSQADYGPRK